MTIKGLADKDSNQTTQADIKIINRRAADIFRRLFCLRGFHDFMTACARYNIYILNSAAKQNVDIWNN